MLSIIEIAKEDRIVIGKRRIGYGKAKCQVMQHYLFLLNFFLAEPFLDEPLPFRFLPPED
jgi:hypothetical protein